MAQFFGAGDAREQCSGGVEIKDMEAAVFKAMLGFIYTDAVPKFKKRKEAVTVMAQRLLAAADRFGLDRLQLICVGKLSAGSISINTVATTLALAEQHRCSELKAKCVEFILGTPAILDAVLATDGYKHLESSCPFVVIDLLKAARGRKI
ncbi:hypothetical protein CFC21_099841 [Triticum aestivum]|uniref:BTB domain-containing protein n=2 Tax=Triticum aestivum TaxID=4565 RepID=A0A9R1LZR5_WHEAT|nr:hypothetical protein CFC21_099841 [Triticum aestivum]